MKQLVELLHGGTLTAASGGAGQGASMRSKPAADLLIDLQVTNSHSRLHVSDDSPYSDLSDFPARFGGIAQARTQCQTFFGWYNTEHRHCGICYMN